MRADTVVAGIRSWADLLALRHRAVHVVGAASVEGAHLLLFFLDHGFTRLVGHDFSPSAEFAQTFKRVHVGWPPSEREQMLQRLMDGVVLRYRDRYLEDIDQALVIAVTQGWYLYDANTRLLESPALQARFLSLIELYLALSPGPVVGVSGSQGKSTTTRLIHDMLEAGGRDVLAAGNDRHGQQALYRLEHAARTTHLVLEISNRHLKMLERSPNLAVLTNVYPNHLDEHGGWQGYVEAKSRLLRYQQAGDTAVLNADLEVTREMREMARGRLFWFGESAIEGNGVQVTDQGLHGYGSLAGFWLPPAALTLPGRHNAANVAAAAAAALALEVPVDSVATAVRRFRGLKHRLQLVWRSPQGVAFYDDLNSTTPTATIAALRTLGPGVVWIFGGDDKGLASDELAEVAEGTVRVGLALPGQGTRRILRDLAAAGVATEEEPDLKQAVARAVALAGASDSVLLSPACPGFFTRFYGGGGEDSGFRRLVKEATTPA